ncbi:MFS transporter [Geochorda subterranea]|uniref:MFS transporter n=1 Tax=Geochorda subterranea TaxID=3109564 RepID=A0ABZ1BSS6_9FIRM|nr:MFS transporter [Limnochorda sp. LNt]WRP15660.1 MFS transporter [Limnochorda sp. LNt]
MSNPRGMLQTGKTGVVSSVVGVCITTVLLMLGGNLVSPVLPLYGLSFGVGMAVVGLLVSAFGVARILVDIPGGRLADRLGARATMMVGCLIVGSASVAAAVVDRFWLLVLARALQGVGSALYMVAGYSFVGRVSPPELRGRTMSYYQGSMLVGQSFGPTIGGFTAEHFGLASPFWAYAAMAVLASAVTLVAVPGAAAERALAERTASAEGHGAEATQPAPRRRRRPEPDAGPTEGQGPTWLLRRADFVLVCLVAFSIAYTRTGARGTVIPLMGGNELGLSESRIGMALTVAAVLNLALLVLTGRVVDHYGRKVAIVPGLVVSAVSLLLFTGAHDYPQYVLAAAVLGLGTGVAGPAPAAYVSDILPPQAFGVSMGLYRTIMDAGMVAGPVVAGAVADWLGLSWALTLNAALLAAVALLFAWRAPETRVAPRAVAQAPRRGAA